MSLTFIADGMLGTLAKWLRLLGYDTIFDPTLNDQQLVRLARAEDRVLLSRDQELVRRRGVRTLLVQSQSLDEQIQQVLADLKLTPGPPLSRCPVCNGSLQEIDQEAARSRVPSYVAQTQDQFRLCPGCQRVYWRGTHWQQINHQLTRFSPKGSEAVPADESEPETIYRRPNPGTE